MIERTPYEVTIEGLRLTVNQLYIDFPTFVKPLAYFENYPTFPNIQIEGKYTHPYKMSANLVVTITIRGTDPLKASCFFIGKVDVSSNQPLKIPETDQTVSQYLYEKILTKYVIEEPICDEKGNLFPVPVYNYPKSKFEDNIWGMLE